MSIDEFRKLAQSFHESEEVPHFEKPSFRVKKKIFATLHSDSNKAVLKLDLINQHVFMGINSKEIYPVKGAWGKQGWTFFELEELPEELVYDALSIAYCIVAPKKLAEKYQTNKS
jgi:predicted DNA-binding protein (MmcQ/YjbR family)